MPSAAATEADGVEKGRVTCGWPAVQGDKVGLTSAVYLSQTHPWGWTQFPFLHNPAVLMGKGCEGSLETPSSRRKQDPFPSAFSGPRSTPRRAGTVESLYGAL